ncbi:ATP-grasp domain-containing protein [Nitrospiraceae bacterium AH_259_D15_M11_P09]|nr:ATP-grasp domain-containing protein [Nitrospiraceae bacterium AH_259_D15_M11_P09]
MNKLNVIFTSAGRRVELLRGFGRAYNALRLEGSIIGLDMDPLAPALQCADRCYVVPPIDSPNYIEVLLEVCRREQPGVVFPLIDTDIPVLARQRAKIENSGVRVAVVTEEAAQVVSDKWLTAQFFRRLGLTTPTSWLPGQVDCSQVSYPLFVKPQRGSAGENGYKVRNANELKFFQEYVPDHIIQEFVEGNEVTCDLLCDLTGDVMGVILRRRLKVRSGEVAKGVTVYNPTIIDACVKIAKALPAIGPITVQCIVRDGVPHFIEINGRMGGGLPLSIAAGADVPRWLLARAAGIPIDIPPLGSYRSGFYMTRFDESFFLSESDYGEMEGRRLRS